MTRATPRFPRLLLALDAASHDLGTLELVVELASRLHSELSGLFVEDINILRSAALPFVRHLDRLTGTPAAFDPKECERELRALASRARAQLASAAERRRVRWSFNVVRGHFQQELCAACTEADVVVVEGTPRAVSRYVATETPLEGVSRSVLLLKPGARLAGPLVAVYDGSEGSHHAVQQATDLAVAEGEAVDVFLLGRSPEGAVGLERKLGPLVSSAPCPVRCWYVPGPPSIGVAKLTHDRGAGLVVVDGKSALLKGGLQALVQGVDCPVLLVRAPEEDRSPPPRGPTRAP